MLGRNFAGVFLLALLMMMQHAGAASAPATRAAETIFPDSVTGKSASNGRQHELGQIFSVTCRGQITKIRLYAVATESGDHTARLWRNSGAMLGEYTIPASAFTGVDGWVEYTLPTPIEVAPKTEYTVSVSTGKDPGFHWADGSKRVMAGSNGIHVNYLGNSARMTKTMGAMPDAPPWFSSNLSFLRDIVFVPAEQVPTSVKISGTDFIEIAQSARHAFFSAMLLDRDGDEITGIKLNLRLKSAAPGVTMDAGSGMITVDSTAADGSITVVATDPASGIQGTANVTVARLAPAAITIVGPHALGIPAAGSVTAIFAAKVRNQLDEIVKGEKVVWSVEPPKAGVTIHSETGTATIDAGATPGSFTVVATAGKLKETQEVTLDGYNATCFLATDDTAMTLAVKDNKIHLLSLKNVNKNWEWISGDVVVPLVNTVSGVAPDWTYRNMNVDSSSGTKITVRFASTTPNLELKSIWWARPGTGPIESWTTVLNKSGAPVTYSPDIAATTIQIRANDTIGLHYAEKTSVGQGHVYDETIKANTHISTTTGMIPFILLDVAAAHHGLYVGYEWEVGGFHVTTEADPLRVFVSANPITENVTQDNNETFIVPNVYYGTYRGDIDDGSNQFKKWFWNYKITRSLHDNADEPWTEACVGDGGPGPTGATPQAYYDKIAATGVECVKFDFWDGTGRCWYTKRDWMFHPEVWPNGFDYGAKAHKAGLKTSLYMGSTYNDCDLTTIAGRDAELTAVQERYDKEWFDVWRTDQYTATKEPMPQTYNGITNFLYIQDNLIKNRPGYRWENCCNGGRYKGFAVCRRMTFCTMNDESSNAFITRTTYYSNSYAINPVQLKSDHGGKTPYDLRTDMLGSILTEELHSDLYSQHIALYKTKQRPILRGAHVYHILSMADGVNWDGLEYFNPGLNKGSIFLFKPSSKALDGDAKVIQLKGLDRHATYTVTFQDRAKLNCTMTGSELMDVGIKVTEMTGDNASEIIWIN